MGFNANQVPGGGAAKKYPEMEPGTYPARLVGLYTLGVQPQRPYGDDPKPPVLEIMLTYELLDEFLPNDDGEPDETKPRWLSESIPFYNLSQDKAKSTKRYLAFDPDQAAEGDWSKLVGSPCMVTLTVDEGKGKNAGKKYENVASVATMRAKDAAKAPPLVNEPRIFDFYEPSLEVFGALPQWLQDKIKGAVDFPGSSLEDRLENKAEEGPKESKKKAEAKVEEPSDDSDW